MTRLLISAPIAILLTLSLFYGLAMITSLGQFQDTGRDISPVIDYLMVRDESDIEVRQRKLPEPEVTPVERPPIPQVETQIDISVDSDLLRIDVPDISVEMDINLMPSLQNLTVVL